MCCLPESVSRFSMEHIFDYATCLSMRIIQEPRWRAFFKALELIAIALATWLLLSIVKSYLGRPVAWAAGAAALAAVILGLYRSFRKV